MTASRLSDLAPTARDALLAAACLAEHQPNRTTAISASLRFLNRFPAASRAWQEAESPDGPAVALVLGKRASNPADVARSLRDAAGGAL